MSEQTEEEYLIERLSKLLAEISVIVNGPQPMGVLWSYADLPEKVQALKDAAALNQQDGVVEALENIIIWYGKRSFDNGLLLPAEKQQPEIAKAMRALAAAKGVGHG